MEREQDCLRYCDKGAHRKRSIFHRALVKAERIGLDKADLVLTEDLPQPDALPYPIEGVPHIIFQARKKTQNE